MSTTPNRNGSEVRQKPENLSQSMNPTAITLADAAAVLTKVGHRSVTPEMLQADVDGGAPTNFDGTVNLIHYAAWLVRVTADETQSNWT